MKILRVRLDEQLGTGLDRLKTERHVNVSSWVRSLIRPALAAQLGTDRGAVGTRPPSAPEPPAPTTLPEPKPDLVTGPLPGWRPWSLDDGAGVPAIGATLALSRMISSGAPSRSPPKRETPGSPPSSKSWNGPRISSWSATPGNRTRFSGGWGLSSRRGGWMAVKQKGSPGGKSLIFHGGIPLDLGASARSCQGFLVGMCLFFLRTWKGTGSAMGSNWAAGGLGSGAAALEATRRSLPGIRDREHARFWSLRLKALTRSRARSRSWANHIGGTT